MSNEMNVLFLKCVAFTFSFLFHLHNKNKKDYMELFKKKHVYLIKALCFVLMKKKKTHSVTSLNPTH
jgi:hypothetical protein